MDLLVNTVSNKHSPNTSYLEDFEVSKTFFQQRWDLSTKPAIRHFRCICCFIKNWSFLYFGAF